MPIVGDFTFIHAKNGQVILGTHADPLRVGDVQGGDGRLVLNFGAGGQNGSQPAMLSMMVRGLTEGSARVVVSGNDNRQVGLIRPFGEAGAPAGSFGSEAAKLWRHEQFFIQNNVLSGANSNSANQLTIFPPPSSIPNTGNFDDFEVRDIYCFFHQNS